MDATPFSGAEPAPNSKDEAVGPFPEMPFREDEKAPSATVEEVRAMMAEVEGKRQDAASTAVAAPPITSASVRVMRSHDYCHFEVVLGSSGGEVMMMEDGQLTDVLVGHRPVSPAEVDALRKAAARLVDKAVEQFKISKADINAKLEVQRKRRVIRLEAERIEREVPEQERTPVQMAMVKCAKDEAYWAQRWQPYDYDDEDEDEDDVDSGDMDPDPYAGLEDETSF